MYICRDAHLYLGASQKQACSCCLYTWICLVFAAYSSSFRVCCYVDVEPLSYVKSYPWTAVHENEDAADDYNEQYLAHPQQKCSSVFQPSFSVTNYNASQRAMGKYPHLALSQHRKHRKHPPTNSSRAAAGRRDSYVCCILPTIFDRGTSILRHQSLSSEYQFGHIADREAAGPGEQVRGQSSSPAAFRNTPTLAQLSRALSASHPIRRDSSTTIYLSAGCALEDVQKAITKAPSVAC